MSAPTPAQSAVAPFTEARGCREWLSVLPLTNVVQVQGQLLDALGGLSAAVTDPLGVSRSYSYGTAKGKLAVTGGSLPAWARVMRPRACSAWLSA